jgi:shikimate kinase
MTSSVILIGPPGAGKSTIGKQLAKKMQVPFTDTDSLIEVEVGTSISEIFVDKGEEWFREIELKILKEQVALCSGVLSLGGGAPLSESAQTILMSQEVPIIYLDVSLATAAPRVGFNRDRPLLLNNPRASWQALMEKRRPIYLSLATHIVNVDDRSPSEIVNETLALLLVEEK